MSSTAVLPIVSQNFLSLSPGYTTVTPSSANSSVSRAGNATLFDSTGKLTWAPNNLALNSQNFTTGWVISGLLAFGSGSTQNTNATTDPFGLNNAALITEDTAAGRHFVYRSIATAIGTQYVASIYVKAGTRTLVALGARNATGTTGYVAVFNLSTGAVSTTNNVGTPTGTSNSIASIGNGWYRISVSMNADTTGTFFECGLSNSATPTYFANIPTYTGDGSSGLYIYGAQLEAVTYQTTPSTYVATTASAYYGPRYDYDPSTLAAKGLLVEAAATNLCTYSQDIANAAWVTKTNVVIAADQISAPDGTTTADQLADDATNGTHRIGCASLAFASGTTYTLSVYAKAGTDTLVQLTFSTGTHSSGPYANFNLSNGTVTQSAGTGIVSGVQSVGNGWYRCFISAPADLTATTNFLIHRINSATATRGPTYAGTGTTIYLWGAQLEAGSFATSYIPTTSASVTRAAETYTPTAYTSKLVMATYTDEQTGSTYYVNLNPGNTWAGNGWITSLRAYDGTTAAVPSWLDVSATTGNRMLSDSTGKLTYAPANMLLNSATLSTQTVTVAVGTSYIVSFQGTGSITLSGAASATINGTGAGDRVYQKVTATTTSLVCTVSGTVTSAQIEPVTYQTAPSTYSPTTTAAYYGPRFDYDPSTLAAKGLLIEESRANIALQSNTFNTTWGIISIAAFGSGSVLNATTSPDGNTNAAQLTAAAATTSHYISQNITWTAAIYTVSFYVKRNTQQYVQIKTWDGTVTRHMNFDILNGTVGTGSNSTGSITNIGNGWYRVSMTTSTAQAAAAGNTTLAFSNSSSASSYPDYATTGTESFFVYGCQIEAGSFATSYIPTTTASVTRAADVIKLSGAGLTAVTGAQSSIITQASTFGQSGPTPIPTMVNISDGTTANYIRVNTGTGYGGRLFVTTGTVNQVNSTTGAAPTDNQTFRIGAAVKLNDFGVSYNGGAVSTDTAGTVPTMTQAAIGNWFTSASTFLNGYVQSIALYNQRLPNATLQTKSTVGGPL